MRLSTRIGLALAVSRVSSLVRADCTANTSSTDDLQRLLTSGGEGYKLSLCAGQTYTLDKILNYTAVGQEISTEGYPQDSSRATLLIAGFNVTTAVQATDPNLDFISLRNVQINGNRAGADIYEHPGANIEIGGDNNGQIVEYVKSWDPRGWSCLHVAEGPFRCRNVTIQNNDIGPCGSDQFQEWADGVSLSCQSSLVQNNDIVDATDGGIVIFGSPNSTIRNNNIHVKTRVLLGGINMVDPVPWPPEGNFSHVIVEGNTISGGFATDMGNDTLGANNASAMIKIGIAIGPRIWFSDGRYGTNQTTGAIIRDNVFSGAFAFAMGLAGVEDCQVDNNTFTGNVSFIGQYGPNCTTGDLTPHGPVPLLFEQPTLTNVTINVADPPADIAERYNDTRAFQNGTANGLTCFLPPDRSSFSWPYGGGQINSEASSTDAGSPTETSGGGGGASSSSPAASATGAAGRAAIWPKGVVIGLGAGLLGVVVGGSII